MIWDLDKYIQILRENNTLAPAFSNFVFIAFGV